MHLENRGSCERESCYKQWHVHAKILKLGNAWHTPASSQSPWPTIEMNSSFQHPQWKPLSLREGSDLFRVTRVCSRARIRPLGSGPSRRCPCLCTTSLLRQLKTTCALLASVFLSCTYFTRCDWSSLGTPHLPVPSRQEVECSAKR